MLLISTPEGCNPPVKKARQEGRRDRVVPETSHSYTGEAAVLVNVSHEEFCRTCFGR
jgi:hypothetical protein